MKKVNINVVVFGALLSVLASSTVYAVNQRDSKCVKLNHAQIASQLNLDNKTQAELIKLMNKHRMQRQQQRKEQHIMRRAQMLALLGEQKASEFRTIMKQKRREHCHTKMQERNRPEGNTTEINTTDIKMTE